MGLNPTAFRGLSRPANGFPGAGSGSKAWCGAGPPGGAGGGCGPVPAGRREGAMGGLGPVLGGVPAGPGSRSDPGGASRERQRGVCKAALSPLRFGFIPGHNSALSWL